MYLHIGNSTVIPEDDVVAVFDLDNASTAFSTRDFLRRAEQDGMVFPTGSELPKSMVVCCPVGSWQRVFLTPLNASAIIGRIKNVSRETF